MLLLTVVSFFVIPLIYQKIKQFGKGNAFILVIFCVGMSVLLLKIIPSPQLNFNNFMVFIGWPGSGVDKNKEVWIAEVKNGNQFFNFRNIQFMKGCRPSKNFPIICKGASVIKYISETSDGTIAPINILLFDQTRSDYISSTLNIENSFISFNNIYQNRSILFMVLWVDHRLIRLMVGFSLGMLAFCLLLFAAFSYNFRARLTEFFGNFRVGLCVFRGYKWDMLVLIPFLLIALIYLWLSTGGTMYKLYSTTYYYDYLANAFLHGQPYLLVEPAKEMLALPDPYDPLANVKWRLHDASLYNGKYYLYWGPAPALVLLVFKYLVPGHMVRDQLVVLGFVLGILFFLIKFVLIIARELFMNIPKWVIVLGMLVLGLAVSQTWLLGRPFIYEAAISGGQFFLLGGLFFAYNAFEKADKKIFLLLLAGIFWALAVGSRATQVFTVACLFFLTSWKILHPFDKRFSFQWKHLLALSLPLIIGMFFLLWYNYIRFGSVTEFGMTFVVAGHRVENTFELGHVIPNLYYYFVRFSTIKFQANFPFIDTMIAQSELISIPKSYVYADNIGLIFVFPFIWIIPTSIIFGSYFSRFMVYTNTNEKLKLIWFGLCLLSTTMALLPQLLFLGAPMRYFADFLPGMGLLSFFIFCFTYSNFIDHPLARNSLLFIFLLLAVVSTIFGFLLGINSEIGQTLFKDTNPTLFNWLVEYIHF